MSRLIAFLLPALALAQCAPPPPPSPEARANAAMVAACREHADAAYNRMNRGSIYSINNRDTPFSGNYAQTVDAGLAQRFGRDSMVRDCVRNTGTETDRSTQGSPPPATP